MTGAMGYRRSRVLSISRNAAPVAEVITPMTRGKRGNAFFRAESNNPRAESLVLSNSNC